MKLLKELSEANEKNISFETKVYCALGVRFTFERSIIRKSRFIFTKERRTIRQKSGCLKHSNERIFLVNILMQGEDQGFLERGVICIKDVGIPLWILSHLS